MTCPDCNQAMNDLNTTTCIRDTVVYPNGTTLKRIPYENRFVSPQDTQHRCHDCGVALGGIHHWGCAMEHCPRCGDQLFFCACFDLSEEHPTERAEQYRAVNRQRRGGV